MKATKIAAVLAVALMSTTSMFGMGIMDSLLDIGSEKTETNKKAKEVPQVFIRVEGGTFQMGSGNGENDEKPVHSVTVSSFYMSDHEVTQKEFRDITGKKLKTTHESDSAAAESVSWYDAVEYCNALSIKKGLTPCYTINKNKKDPNNKDENDTAKWTVTCDFSADGYRLPTEAEWEYAARGGNKSKGYKYSGSNKSNDVAWRVENREEYDDVHEVKEKAPNELGLYDMSGNVFEWCWDWKGDYSSQAQTNPVGPSSGEGRVMRGGSYGYDESYATVTRRLKYTLMKGTLFIGFRVVRTAK